MKKVKSNKNEKSIQLNNILEDIKKLIDEIKLNYEEKESLVDLKENMMDKTLNYLEHSFMGIIIGGIMTFPDSYYIYDRIKTNRSIFDYDKKYSSVFAEIIDWALLPIGLTIFTFGLILSRVAIYNFSTYLFLAKKLKKAKELKHQIKEFLDSKPEIQNQETKTYLNLLEYHTTPKELQNDTIKIEKNEAGPISNKKSIKVALKAGSNLLKADLEIKRKKKYPIKNNWVVS